MSEESFQERTEEATSKRRSDAREKGQVTRSMDLNSALMLLFGLLLLYLTGDRLTNGLGITMRDYLSRASTFEPTPDSLRLMIVDVVGRLVMLMGPIVGGLMVIGLAANFAQVGFTPSLEPLKPSFKKLNPLTGLKKVVISRRSAVELAKNVIKSVIVGLIAWAALDGVISETVPLMDGEPTAIMGFMAKAALGVGFKTGLAFLALSAFDYFYQRFEFEKSIRMTKQEIKEENKEQDGDPQIKGRIRNIQRKIAYKRMMQDVPKADVVVTNPTHLAVALRYDGEKMAAPRVVAKGAGPIAERIKEIARNHSVPVVENKPLARALYKGVEVGDEIPEKLFQAVAQVLAYIYRLRTSRSRVN